MQAIILAAGMGKRLKDLTSEATKCMVKVNGVAMIDRMMGHLDKLGLSRVVVVVGYEGQKLMDYIDALGLKTPIVYVNNEIYNKTMDIFLSSPNLYSFRCVFIAKNYLCIFEWSYFRNALFIDYDYSVNCNYNLYFCLQ